MAARRATYSDYRDRLRQNREELARDLDADQVMDKLFSESVFTLDEMEEVLAPATRHEKTTRLLNQLPRKGPSAFVHFLDALEETFPDLREMLMMDITATEEDQQRYLGRVLDGGQVPARPEYYADRPKEIQQVRDALRMLQDEDGFVVLHGMGGSGKTMLASEALRDHCLLQECFPDGVFWLTIGQIQSDDGQVDSSKLLMKMQNLCARLENDGSERPPNIEAAHDRLVKIFSEEYDRALLVLDDVWSQVVARAFAVRCRCLVTSRFAAVANQTRAPHLAIVALQSGFSLDQTKTVLSAWTGISREQLPPEARELHEQCQGLPLAVAMLGALLKPDPKALRWNYYLKHLKEKKVSRIHSTSSDSSTYDSLSASMALSVDALGDRDRELYEYYKMFAIFDDDPVISSQVLAALWGFPDPIDAEVRMDGVLEMSLAYKLPPTQVQRRLNNRKARTVPVWRAVTSSSKSGANTPPPPTRNTTTLKTGLDSLGRTRSLSISQLDYAHYTVHDLQLDYLKEELVGEETRKIYHQRLVSGYAKKCNHLFHDLPDDGYVHRYLGFHMMEAGEVSKQSALLTDLRWISAKLQHCGADDLLNDYLRFIEHEKRAKQVLEPKPTGVVPRRRPGRRQTKQTISRPSSVDPRLLDEVQVYQRFISIHAHRLLEDSMVSVIQLGLGQPQDSLIYKEAYQLAQQDVKHNHAFYLRLCNASEDVRSHRLTVRVHQHAVSDVKCSPDSLIAASCSTDLSVRLWNRVTGAMVATLEGHENYVTGCCFNPVDTSQIVSSSEDGSIRVWQIETGRESSATQICDHSDDDIYMCCDISPDGEQIVAGNLDGGIKILCLVTCKLLQQVAAHKSQVYSCVYSKDGQFIATCSSTTAKLWSAHDLTKLCVFTKHKLILYCCAFSWKSDRLITCSADSTVKVWSTSNPVDEELATMHKEGSTLMTCTFSPNDKYILSGSNFGMLHVFEATSYSHMYSVAAHSGWVQALAFDPNSKTFVTGSDDCTCKVWELSEIAQEEKVQYDKRLNLFVDDDTGALTLSSLSKTHNTLEIKRSSAMQVLENHAFDDSACIKSFALSRDLKTVTYASTEGRVRISKTTESTQDVEADIAQPERKRSAGCVDGSGGSSSGAACDANPDSVLLDDEAVHQSEVKTVAYTPDGRYAVTASMDGVQAVWSIGEEQANLHLALRQDMASKHVPFVFFHHRPWLLSSTLDGKLKVYSLDSKSEVMSWQSGEASQPLSMSIAKDDSFIAVSVNKSLKIWTVKELEAASSVAPVAELEGPKDVIRSCAISPDGQRVASGSDDLHVVLWETVHYYEVNKMKVFSSVSWIVDMKFSGDSSLLVSLSDRISFWLASDGTPVRTVHLNGAFTKYIRTDADFTSFATVDDKGILYLFEAVFEDDDEGAMIEP